MRLMTSREGSTRVTVPAKNGTAPPAPDAWRIGDGVKKPIIEVRRDVIEPFPKRAPPFAPSQ